MVSEMLRHVTLADLLEAPSPRYVVGEGSSNKRADNRGDSEAGEESALVGLRGVEDGDLPDTNQTKVLSSVMQRSQLGNNDHCSGEESCCTKTGDGSAEDEDVHVGCGTAHDAADLEDEDRQEHDMLRGEHLVELRVDEVEAEECEEETACEP